MKVKHLKEFIQELDDEMEVHVRINYLNVFKITKENIVFDGLMNNIYSLRQEHGHNIYTVNDNINNTPHIKNIKKVYIKQIRLPNGLKFEVEKTL